MLVNIVGLLAVVSASQAKMVWEQVPVASGSARDKSIGSKSVLLNNKKYQTSYNAIQRSGEVNGGTFGARVDMNGRRIVGLDISNSPDFTSLLDLGTSNRMGNIVYSITQFETSHPASAYLSKLIQNPSTGALTVETTEPLDFSQWRGVWNPCAGSVSPWSTHLGSEEYEPDARRLVDDDASGVLDSSKVEGAVRYMGKNPGSLSMTELRKVYKPYWYGLSWEATVNPRTGKGSVVKHPSMGRRSNELAYVMPDKKTVYLTDDGTNQFLSMFVAKRAGDLSSGTLYAAKMTDDPRSNAPGGKYNIQWINLGEASDSEILTYMNMDFNRFNFYTMFDARNPSGSKCPTGFTIINTSSGGLECLKVKPGMDKAASRLETRRYAAVMGATTEFNKWEGITFDTKRNVLYTSISKLDNGMLDKDSDDLGTGNHIREKKNSCGCVYKMELRGMQAKSMEGFLCGESGGNDGCKDDGLANPDNLSYVDGHDALFIGEDTSRHDNAMGWYYDLQDRKLTRVLTSARDAEVTGTYYYKNINGFQYLMAQIQHPFGSSSISRLSNTKSGIVGFLGTSNGGALPATRSGPSPNPSPRPFPPRPPRQCLKLNRKCGGRNMKRQRCCRGRLTCTRITAATFRCKRPGFKPRGPRRG